jgi:hypothetical protein
MDDFLEYYQSNRRLQLNSDLTPPQNFIESYQNFIAQVHAGPIMKVRPRHPHHAVLSNGLEVL